MYMQQKTGSFKESFSKNTFYRFLNSLKTNWLRFTTLLSKRVADAVEPLTSEDRVNAFVVDDSLFERTSCLRLSRTPVTMLITSCTTHGSPVRHS
jgi:hypothetical protein